MYSRESAAYEFTGGSGHVYGKVYVPAWATKDEVLVAIRDLIPSAMMVKLDLRRIGEIAKWSEWVVASTTGGVYYQVLRAP